VPDPQNPQTFQDSKLDWTEVTRGQHARLLAWYTDLIRLRRERLDLHDGRLDRVEVDHDHERGTFWMRRGETEIAVNLSEQSRTLQVGGVVRLAWEPGLSPSGGTIELPPQSAVILEA